MIEPASDKRFSFLACPSLRQRLFVEWCGHELILLFPGKVSRHPFFDTQEGAFHLPRTRVEARLFYISCRTMQRKPFFEGMGSVRATRRVPLRNVKVPQKWGSRLIPAASVFLRGLCPALNALAARGRHRAGAPFSPGLPGDSECLRAATTRVCRCAGFLLASDVPYLKMTKGTSTREGRGA